MAKIGQNFLPDFCMRICSMLIFVKLLFITSLSFLNFSPLFTSVQSTRDTAVNGQTQPTVQGAVVSSIPAVEPQALQKPLAPMPMQAPQTVSKTQAFTSQELIASGQSDVLSPPPAVQQQQTSALQDDAARASQKAATKITEQVEKATKALKKVTKTAEKLVQAFTLEPKNPFPQFQPQQIPSKVVGTKTEVSISISTSLSGKNDIIGTHINEGMMLVFNHINTDYPSSNYFVQTFSGDDKSDALYARNNINQLQSNSPVFLSLLGDENLFTALSSMLRSQLLALFPIAGVDTIRKAGYRNLVFFRPPYEKEIEALTAYAIYRLRRKKIAIFYEESDWGNECRKKVIEVLKRFDIKPVELAAYPDGSVNVSDAVDRIAKKSPNVVFCIATPRPASTFIRLAINKGLYKSVFLGFSELVVIQKILNKLRGANMITSSVVPDPLRSNLPLVQQFRTAMQKYLPNQAISPFYFEGYINALIFLKVLNMAQPPITTEKIISTLEDFKDFDLYGLKLSFNPAIRTLSDQVWINEGEGKDFIQASDIKMDE